MKRVPGAVFIVDPHRERIAVTEANKLEIPVVGDRRHERRPGRDRLHHPGQRRRDPVDPAALPRWSPTPASRASRSAPRARVEPEPEVAIDRRARVRRVRLRRARRRPRRRRGADVRARRGRRGRLLPGARPTARRPTRRRPAEATPEEIAAELAREAAEKEEPATAGLTAAARAQPTTTEPAPARGPPRAAHDTGARERTWRTSLPTRSRSSASAPAPA